MKNAQRILSTVAVIVTLTLTFLVSVSSVAQDKKPTVPTKKELKTLLKTAKESPEHLRIAAYYWQEAARLTASSKEHAELADIYAKTDMQETSRRQLQRKCSEWVIAVGECIRSWSAKCD